MTLLKCTNFKYNVVRIDTLLTSTLLWRKQQIIQNNLFFLDNQIACYNQNKIM